MPRSNDETLIKNIDMKKIYTLIAAVLLTATVWAQSPNKMSYQAVVRNASNELVTNQAIGMQISILQGAADGSSVYTEIQSPTTNTNGLVSVEIGTGSTSDNFSSIDWANGPYFIKTETDPAADGGMNYTITGTSQLMSVPYALHAKTAESITGVITETDPVFGASVASEITVVDTVNWNSHTVDTDTQLDEAGITALGFVAGAHTVDTDTQLDETTVDMFVANNGYLTTETDGDITNEIQDLVVSITGDTLTISGGNFVLVPGVSFLNHPPAIGDFRDGGVVFWLDGNGGGLVCATYDLSKIWGCSGTEIIGADGTVIGSGGQHTIDIEAGCSESGTAADMCANLALNGYSDWFLPSKDELKQIFTQKESINITSLANGGSALRASVYWSSTEHSSTQAKYISMVNGFEFFNSKGNTYRTRAVRAF